MSKLLYATLGISLFLSLTAAETPFKASSLAQAESKTRQEKLLLQQQQPAGFISQDCVYFEHELPFFKRKRWITCPKEDRSTPRADDISPSLYNQLIKQMCYKMKPQSERVLLGIAKVMALDKEYTNEVAPAKKLNHGAYLTPSVNALRAWLASPLQDIMDYDAVVDGEEIIPDGFERVKKWCVDLVRNYDENSTDNNSCQTIRKKIGSFCALHAARTWCTPIKTAAPISVNELLQAGGDARALYEELAIGEYENRCDNPNYDYLPQALQQKIESFLYDPCQVMKNLHTIETNIVGTAFISYDWFLVGSENFTGIYNRDGSVRRADLYGLFTTDHINKYIRSVLKRHPKAEFNSIESVHGDSNNFYLRLRLSENTSIDGFFRINSLTSGMHATVNKIIAHSTTNISAMGIVSNCAYNNRETEITTKEAFSSQPAHTVTSPGRWDIVATNDSADLLVALGNCDTSISPSAGYENLLIKEYGQPSLIVSGMGKIFSPVLAVCHAQKNYAIGYCDEKGESCIRIASTLEEKESVKILELAGPCTNIKQLAFSHDDSHLFITIDKKDKEKVDLYYMINVAHFDSPYCALELTRCYPPQPRIPCENPIMTAIDPYGEYIGCHMQSTTLDSTKVIPTDYHLAKKLVPDMQRMCHRDRQVLYLLDEAIRRAPGAAHICPEQWKSTFKKLGLLPHLFFRPRLHLTTRDGTKLQGLLEPNPQQPEKPVHRIKKSLSDMHAVYAASRIE